MPASPALLEIYLNLAKVFAAQHRPQQQERVLALATMVACSQGRFKLAESFRDEISKLNPNHAFTRFKDVNEAVAAPDVAEYLRSLSRIYPFERAEFLLEKFSAAGFLKEDLYWEDPSKEDVSAIWTPLGDDSPSGHQFTPSKGRPPLKVIPAAKAVSRPAVPLVTPSPGVIISPEIPPTGFVPVGATVVLTIVGFAVGFVVSAMISLIVR